VLNNFSTRNLLLAFLLYVNNNIFEKSFGSISKFVLFNCTEQRRNKNTNSFKYRTIKRLDE